MTTLVLMVWVVLDVPFMFAFDVQEDLWSWGWHRIISAGVDIFFMADVILNFNTGVEVAGKVCLDRRVIAKEYLKSWFWVDIISAFPLEYVLNDAKVTGGGSEDASKLIKVSKIGKVVSRQSFYNDVLSIANPHFISRRG
jgi:hypothetical protein